MSCTIQLVRLIDGGSDVDVLDLSTGGYSLAQDGYFQTAAPDDVKSVFETITLKLQGTSKNDLASMTQEIDEKIKQVGWWLRDSSIERYQVWLRIQLENETYPRQAQILSILPPDKVRTFTPEERIDNYLGSYTISFERTPFWEDPYPYPTTSTISGINALNPTSGTQIGETIRGDVPARLYKFNFTPATESGASYRGWFGFKTSRFGNPANFLPFWSVTNNYQLDTDTTVSSGIATTTFGTVPTLTQRIMFRLGTLTAHPNDQRGVYTLLMRAKTDSGTLAHARIRYAMGGGSIVYTPIYRSLTPINPIVPGEYDIYEMGDIVIPPKQATATDDLTEFYVALDVARINGSGNFYTAGFLLIPKEAMIRVKQQFGASYFNVSTDVSTWQRPDNDIVSYRLVSGTIADALVSIQKDWGLPANDEKPYLVSVLDNIETNLNYVTIDVSYTYIPRWRTLRGNET